MHRHHLPSLRRIIQAGITLFCLYAGWQLYCFYQWAIDASTVYVARPPAVEGFLPISALVAAKRLVLSQQYDPVHPAGLTIFLAAVSLGLLFRKGFCGWLCPVGFISNLAESTGRRFRINLSPPVWLDLPLLALKYLLLAFFAYLILWRMPLADIDSFLNSNYNRIVDVKMLYFFLEPSRLAAGSLLGLLILSFVLRNPWCRYLCPYGALLGLLALISPFQVRRNPAECIDCKKCERACPAAIRVSQKKTVRTPECIGCLECVAVCPPQERCLGLKIGPKPSPPYLLPALILVVFFGFWLTARLTGHWHNELPLESVKKHYQLGQKMIDHP